jgi:hypothetical protein
MGGSKTARTFSARLKAWMKPRLDHAGRAFDALFGEQDGLQALARGVAGVQALDIAAAVDEGEQAAGARSGKPERVREPLGRERGEFAGGGGRAEHADRGGRMESALAQVGMAGAADGDHRLVARDDRLH